MAIREVKRVNGYPIMTDGSKFSVTVPLGPSRGLNPTPEPKTLIFGSLADAESAARGAPKSPFHNGRQRALNALAPKLQRLGNARFEVASANGWAIMQGIGGDALRWFAEKKGVSKEFGSQDEAVAWAKANK